MRTPLLLALLSAALLTTACSGDKTKAETQAEARAALITPGTDPYHPNPEWQARQVVYNLSLAADTALTRRITGVFTTRARSLTQLQTRYATDTAGRYAAIRTLNDDTDQAIATLLPDPGQQRRYRATRATIYAGTPFTRTTAERRSQKAGKSPSPSATQPVGRSAAAPRPRTPAVVDVKRRPNGDVKIRYANGTTVVRDRKGQRKTRKGLRGLFKGGNEKHKDK